MIDATALGEVFKDCLFTDAEATAMRNGARMDGVVADGIVAQYAFHAERLEGHRAEVAEWLSMLHPNFAGGWSFLMAAECAPFDTDGRGPQWGEHPSMEKLFTLGVALGLAKSMFDRSMWSALPGGMPYYLVEGAVGYVPEAAHA